tara:strand:+ start:13355 stop:14338 length:984 start_codon:yes stop_codon:yes gene_type:complete
MSGTAKAEALQDTTAPAEAVEAAEPVEVLADELDDLEVSVVDDTPSEDQRPPRVEGSGEEDDDLDESQFGNRIRKRIDKLRYEWNEERRAKEGALRENQEAVNYAQAIQGENQNLKQQLADQRKLLYDQVSAKTDAEIDGAKRRYKEAYEAGDADGITDAQSELSRLNAERAQYVYAPAQPVPQQAAVQHPQQQPQQQAVPPPDPLTVDWLKKNTWFQSPGYEEMTGFAIGLHEKLVLQGMDPRGNPQYYENIDAALQKQFAEHFGKTADAGDAPTSRRTPVVAPARRGGKAPRRVELNQSQVNLARKLGLTPEQYAQQLVKEMGNG